MTPFKLCEKISEPLKIPVLAGVFLLKSAKNAVFINKVVPGACIPENIIARLDQAPNPLEEGISIAAEQVKNFTDIAQGVHIMAVKAEKFIPKILEKSKISY